MRTPIVDFIKKYNTKNGVRFHMPGHKGKNFLGFEDRDITEIKGADSLYEAHSIIDESEKNAAALFGSKSTFFSTEGSSQCIKAMLYLAVKNRPADSVPVIVAARNVHKSFVYAAALLDLEIVWLWPDIRRSLCSCDITPKRLEEVLRGLGTPPAAVYITSPDYLGGMADIAAFSDICHRYGTILAVDNAHGAYLHFLPDKMHPLDLGADICCDSAHKTLPVITGGAYLHIGRRLGDDFVNQAKQALEIFGSTSPSYLILASLDECNRYIADRYRSLLAERVKLISGIKYELKEMGWRIENSDPLRITVKAPEGCTGTELSDRLSENGIECEYADRDYMVLMATPENDVSDFERLKVAMGVNILGYADNTVLPLAKGKNVLTVREALFSRHETVPVDKAFGRVCGAPTVSCPPAIPIAISGEVLESGAIELFKRYGISNIDVVKQP